MPAQALSRRQLGLLALALPILGMMGLFAWSGSQPSPSQLNAVTSFITAFNQGNCAAMTQELYRASGSKAPTCAQLVGTGNARLVSCGLSAVPKVDASSLLARVPANYTAPEVVRAACTETVKEKGVVKHQLIDFDFLVATDLNGAQQIITLEVSPS